ncbi:hypothetical protein GOP47_0013799 [Adiantum capillus-veneris]|uniref:Uncharacterized protein n=1 Tax=Adiantum capillus-veneris TaxID=13818 RepID=A0A9D4UP77_ADICA|nr:hypothetical protein GOP47_0013799 [Adiantum capillus-veneris]
MAGRVNQALAAIHELKQHFKQSIHSETDQEYVGMAVARKSKEAEVQARRFKTSSARMMTMRGVLRADAHNGRPTPCKRSDCQTQSEFSVHFSGDLFLPQCP